MATAHSLLDDARAFYEELQERTDAAEKNRVVRWRAVMTLQRLVRGRCIRNYVKRLHRAATHIQTAWRGHAARLLYRRLVREAARDMHAARYHRAATLIQAAYRGDRSRKTLFCYATYRRWLQSVAAASAQRLTQAAEFGARSRESDARALEREAQRWLAFIVFKLHHLLRTASCAGVYSLQATTELSELERLLACVRYTKYTRRVRARYTELVKQRPPHTHKDKTFFPIIGDGADYWYLSLAELYELTAPCSHAPDTRGQDTHHDISLHPCPFIWRRPLAPPPPQFLARGPFRPSPPPQPVAADQHFHLYVKKYKPNPTLLRYVDFHINALLKKKSNLKKM